MKYITLFTVFLAGFIILSSAIGIGILMNWESLNLEGSRSLIVSVYFSSIGAMLITMIYVIKKKPFKNL